MNVADVLREAREAGEKTRAGYTQLRVDTPGLGGVPCSRPPYTREEMRHALVVGWGALGGRVADAWGEYNALYFGGRLAPLPIFLTPVSPYGHWVGLTCISKSVTHIALTAPRDGTRLVADRDTLLHEMVHQYLFEAGVCPHHAGGPWRWEIMRLHKQITGQDIWAGKYTVAKRVTDHSDRVSVRTNAPHPRTGQASLGQQQIARWPHGTDIKLGPL
jgi:hypothetical protein